jgi:oligosaccharide repeat unit polymerase
MDHRLLWKGILLLFSVLVISISSYAIVVGTGSGDSWKLTIFYVFIFWLLGHVLFTSLHYRTLYLFSNAYLVPLVLFHLGITIPDALGLFTGFGWGGGLFNRWLELSGWYTILALGCFSFGIALSFRYNETQKNDNIIVKQNLKKVYVDGLGLLVASAIFFIIAYLSYGNFLQYSRVDFFRGVGDSRGFGVFMMVFPSSILLLTITAQKRIEKIFCYSLALLGLMVFMLSGYRSAALFPLLVGCVLWVKAGRKIHLPFSLGLIVIVILSIPFIGYLRSVGPYNEIDSKKITTSLEHVKVQETFRTLGQTGGVLANVLKLVPDKDPYRFGMTYVNSIIDSIPNVLPKIAKSKRHEAKKEAFSDPSAISKMVPSDWLTYRIAKEKFNRGEGVGFTGIGEPYLNGGIIGVIFFFGLLGLFIGKIDSVNLLYHPNIMLFAGAMMWPLIRTVRNDFSNFIKPAVFMLIIIVIWRVSLKALPLKKEC